MLKNKLLLLVFTGLAVAFCVPAYAMWVTVTRNEAATVYVDSASIVQVGTHKRIWVVYDLTNQDVEGKQSVRSYIEYDCAEAKYKTLSASSHANRMGNGPVLKSLPVPGDWKLVTQDALSRQLYSFACAW
jgi:hypothetical protein